MERTDGREAVMGMFTVRVNILWILACASAFLLLDEHRMASSIRKGSKSYEALSCSLI